MAAQVLPTSSESEVVGASGRMGSQWIKQTGSRAVPRGLAPGCLSAIGKPIYVTTSSKSWEEIILRTPTRRHDDLVWIGNGLLRPEMKNSTFVVPHYAILKKDEGVITNALSPPTYVCGKHASTVASALEADGIRVEIVSWNDVRVAAARKLLWASCMWLICHTSSPPLTVAEVHKTKQEMLLQLVREVWPALQHEVGIFGDSDGEKTLTYLQTYSDSIPSAVPSKDLAMEEFRERNGVSMQLRDSFAQPFHEELLMEVGGVELLLSLELKAPAITSRRSTCVDLKDLGLSLWGTKGHDIRSPSTAVVVGAGILGSAVALNLARKGVQVTVLDRLGDAVAGDATRASWAWINANQKFPLSYRLLNQLGIEAWHRDMIISHLPDWKGALVRFSETLKNDGGYSCEGPLSVQRLLELDPQASLSQSDGFVYYFPEEGSVDPVDATNTMRRAAKDLGVIFIAGQNVTGALRDPTGRINGVVSGSSTFMADVIVTAAGIGVSSPVLGGLPLLHRPGRIAFAKPVEGSTPLTRILVDTIEQSHVLQRPDGTIVAGGGFLEVGGSSSSDPGSSAKLPEGEMLLERARLLAPESLRLVELTGVMEAVRPMPQDGLPVVGFVDDGLFAVVAHSGVTLAPFLAPLIAAELVHNVDLELLDNYRPDRFADASP
jgi:glycine/D-amino acid oxidase-like deaminating enzyme